MANYPPGVRNQVENYVMNELEPRVPIGAIHLRSTQYESFAGHHLS